MESLRPRGEDDESAPAPGGCDIRTLVPVAFRLGWHMAELYAANLRQPPHRVPAAEPPERLPGLGKFSRVARARLVVSQIAVDLRHLGAPCTAVGIELPPVDELVAGLEATPVDAVEFKRRVLHAHERLLDAFMATDFRLGKAYGLGRALAETARLPSPNNLDAFRHEFAQHRIVDLCGWLDDLSSSFPPYTAAAVSGSLFSWMNLIGKRRLAGVPEPFRLEDHADYLTQVLRDQGRIWRALLSDEKRAEDLLDSGAFVRAAVNLVRQIKHVTVQFMRAWFWIIVPAAALLIALVVAMFVFLPGNSEAVGAIAATLAGAGISWKALGSTLGKALARAERPIWDAEFAASVAEAANQVPRARKQLARRQPKPAAPVRGHRLHLAHLPVRLHLAHPHHRIDPQKEATMALEKLTKPQPDDAVRAGTMNLTLVSGFVAALGMILNAIPGVMKTVVGTSSAGVRASIFIAIIAAFAVIAAADMLSRAYASRKPVHEALPLNALLHVDREDIESEKDDWEAVALRETMPTNGDGKLGVEFLLTKENMHPAWVAQERIRLHR